MGCDGESYEAGQSRVMAVSPKFSNFGPIEAAVFLELLTNSDEFGYREPRFVGMMEIRADPQRSSFNCYNLGSYTVDLWPLRVRYFE